jgi:hypothetical protein
MQLLGNAPGDAHLVGDTENDAALASHQTHAMVSLNFQLKTDY